MRVFLGPSVLWSRAADSLGFGVGDGRKVGQVSYGMRRGLLGSTYRYRLREMYNAEWENVRD